MGVVLTYNSPTKTTDFDGARASQHQTCDRWSKVDRGQVVRRLYVILEYCKTKSCSYSVTLTYPRRIRQVRDTRSRDRLGPPQLHVITGVPATTADVQACWLDIVWRRLPEDVKVADARIRRDTSPQPQDQSDQ